ncbi:MAG: hypothetical protein RLY57_26 [Candidatus Parcubacteria bacterium]|jgi:shikimate dehydrogenase
MKHFAVIGHPLDHSLSPRLFEAGFKALGLAAIYDKKDVNASELEGLINDLRTGTYSGFSVTVPYKESVIPFLDTLTPQAQMIGAVNTLYIRDGKVIGENTDWYGFKKVLNDCVDIRNKKILIYGAGGVARACLYALQDIKNDVFITNRTQAKAQILAKEFGVTYVSNTDLPHVDICINATSIGLHSDTQLIVSPEWLKRVSVVFDLTYGETLLTNTAKELGIQTLDAKEMLLHQAVRQFEIFTDQVAPLIIMQKSLRNSLLT